MIIYVYYTKYYNFTFFYKTHLTEFILWWYKIWFHFWPIICRKLSWFQILGETYRVLQPISVIDSRILPPLWLPRTSIRCLRLRQTMSVLLGTRQTHTIVPPHSMSLTPKWRGHGVERWRRHTRINQMWRSYGLVVWLSHGGAAMWRCDGRWGEARVYYTFLVL